MKRILENLKSFILTILIFLSLFLTGSLWFDNYQGLSLLVSSFHNNLLAKMNTENESLIVYDKIIVPYKLTVINPDKNKWVFYETDGMTSNAWNIVKSRLDKMPIETEIITGKVKEWDGLFSRKSIILEFGGSLNYDVLRLAIPNLPKESAAFNNVEKIGVTKSLEGHTIYIFQNDNNKKSLYKVLLKGDDSEIETFMGNCENVKTEVRYVELEKVGTTKFYDNKEIVAQSSVLFPLSNITSRKETVKALSISPYFDMNDEYSINRFVIKIFNNTDFAKFITNDESSIFINDDKSSVKFEKDGVIEYINNSKLSGELTSAASNFNIVMNFINNMQIYDEVYLLSANENDGLYTFRFSVAFDGILLGFLEPVIDDDIHAVIEIQATENSIRYFKGKFLEINETERNSYITKFTHNILDELLDDIEAETKTNVSLLELMYLIDNSGTYYPSWFVKYSDKKIGEENTSVTYTMRR